MLSTKMPRGFEVEVVAPQHGFGIRFTARPCTIELVWAPGMDSNHELDRILMSHNLLILQSR
jgi:hypothetical protein